MRYRTHLPLRTARVSLSNSTEFTPGTDAEANWIWLSSSSSIRISFLEILEHELYHGDMIHKILESEIHFTNLSIKANCLSRAGSFTSFKSWASLRNWNSSHSAKVGMFSLLCKGVSIIKIITWIFQERALKVYLTFWSLISVDKYPRYGVVFKKNLPRFSVKFCEKFKGMLKIFLKKIKAAI